MSEWTVERGDFGCILWTGRIDRDGYGRFGNRLAHEVSFEEHVGPVPPDKTLDHICRRRRCVAYYHLEPISRSEQEWRKRWNYRARIAKCPLGHDLTTNQAVNDEGGRTCRTCNRDHAHEEIDRP